MIKNIFITGKPGCGKTTLIKEISKELKPKIFGFYTEEIREKEKRVGFKIKTLDKKEGILAHIKFKSKYQVGKYKVNLKDLEEIGVSALEKAIKEKKIVLIDEIGKMPDRHSLFGLVRYLPSDSPFFQKGWVVST